MNDSGIKQHLQQLQETTGTCNFVHFHLVTNQVPPDKYSDLEVFLTNLFVRERELQIQPGDLTGRIASGNSVMKNGPDHDRTAASYDVICLEMEGPGVCGKVPWIIVKGIYNYLCK